ncbi:MAG: Wlab protein [uncultured bacterium]|nr:MAG: Wlab protein [uncultured bacterium]
MQSLPSMNLKIKYINEGLFTKLIVHLIPSERKHFYRLIYYSLLIGTLEVFGLFVILPFVKTVQNPSFIVNNLKTMGISVHYNHLSLIIMSGVVLLMIYIIKNGISLIHIFYSHQFSGNVHTRLSQSLLFNYLNTAYETFIKTNAADFQLAMTQYTTVYRDTLVSFLLYISDISLLIIIVALLLIINYQITLIVMGAFFLSLFFMLKYLSLKSTAIGILNKKQLSITNKLTYDALFNIKIVKLFFMGKMIEKNYHKEVVVLNEINSKYKLYAYVPRYLVEIFSFFMIVVGVALGIYFEKSIDKLLPTISLFMLAILKISQILMRMSSVINTMKYNEAIIDAFNSQEKNHLENHPVESIDFKCNICFKDVAFVYRDGQEIFRNINCLINKGDKIGIMGASGVGKSTLLDVLMGFLTPTSGGLYIDDQQINHRNIASWQQKIGYVPQEIFLYNDSILKNIVLNRELDYEKLVMVLKKAHIYDFCMSKNGSDTIVGNNGNVLSSGQKQRIGIARALYDDPELLILDEATAALDEATEQRILDEIYSENSDKTIIMVSHRSATLKYCDKIYNISETLWL